MNNPVKLRSITAILQTMVGEVRFRDFEFKEAGESHRRGYNDLISVCFDSTFNRIYLSYWKCIIEHFGTQIISIDNSIHASHINSGDLMEIAAEFCPNLENVELIITKDSIEKVAAILTKIRMINSNANYEYQKKLTKLKHIRIIELDSIDSYENLFVSLKSVTELRSLKLEIRPLKTSEAKQLNELHELEHLEELDIDDVNQDDIDHLNDVFKNVRVLKLQKCNGILPYLPKLTHLEMITGPIIYVHILDRQYNDTLQVLNVGHHLDLPNNAFERIVKLKSLKHFIHYHLSDHIGFLMRMPIEELTTTRLPTPDILRLVYGSSTLRILNIIANDWEFVHPLLKVLEEKGFTPDQQFRLNIITDQEDMIIPKCGNSNLVNLNIKSRTAAQLSNYDVCMD